MAVVIEQIRAKVTRANQHIQDFQLALKAFDDTNPYAIGIDDDPQAGQRYYRLTKVDEIPFGVTTIASDVLQNLRDTLDHIATQLVIKSRNGAPPDWNVHFPITKSPSEYPALRTRNVKEISQLAIDAIDATEPYKGGKGHALWQLSELNNFGKHILLVPAGSFYSSVDVSSNIKNILKEMGVVTDSVPDIRLRPADRLLALKTGDLLFSEPLSEMNNDYQFTFDVSFDKPGIIECESVLEKLQDMSRLIGGIVESFAPLVS